MCFAPQRHALFRHLNFRSWCVLCIFTSKCASRNNGVHFFDIATSKNGPTMVCFVHFHLQMCFAPQRLFRHRNFQKRSDAEVFCTFWLANVLRATTACNFSSLIWPAGSAPAALASLLFDPPEPQIIGKTQCFATFLPFQSMLPFPGWGWGAPFCSEPTPFSTKWLRYSLHPTKWSVYNPWLYKMVVPVTCFDPHILTILSRNDQTSAFMIL